MPHMLTNEVARNIENEIAYQREITDEAKNALKGVKRVK